MVTPDSSAARAQWLAVATFAVATLIVASELSLSGLALPMIATEFGVDAGAAAWVTLAYSLPLAALAIPAGRWVDRADLRLVFTLSLLAVGATSVVAAVMPWFGALVAARVLQGAASALYLAVYLPLVAASVRQEQRGRAMSYIATIMVVGSMAVAPLGGVVAEAWGWRAVFLAKVPLLTIVIALGWRTVPATAAAGARLPRPDRFLLGETVLVGGAITAVLVALDQSDRWQVALAAAALAAVLVVGWARLPESKAVIGLIRSPEMGLVQLALLLAAALVALLTFLLPFYLAEVAHAGADVLGVAILCFVAAASALAPVAGFLADRFGPLPVATGGTIVTIAGLTSMLTLDEGAGVVDLSWRMAVIGIGGALSNSPIMTAILNATPADRTGTAGGVTNVARTLGQTLGPAAVAAAWGLADGAGAGFDAGLVVLLGCSMVGLLALLAARSASPRS